jgi:hypothetical protein
MFLHISQFRFIVYRFLKHEIVVRQNLLKPPPLTWDFFDQPMITKAIEKYANVSEW